MRNCQQAGVAAGCTPLSQVYDIGLAAQCNARVKREKDLLSLNTNQIQHTLQAAIHMLQLKSNSHNSVSQKAESHKLLKRDNQAQKTLELCST